MTAEKIAKDFTFKLFRHCEAALGASRSNLRPNLDCFAPFHFLTHLLAMTIDYDYFKSEIPEKIAISHLCAKIAKFFAVILAFQWQQRDRSSRFILHIKPTFAKFAPVKH